MHDDALKQLWRSQKIEPGPGLPDSAQLASMKTRLQSMERTLFWRDCRENIAALFIMLCFGFYFLIFQEPLARVGSAIVVLSALVVIVYPIWRKRRVPKGAPDTSMRQALELELRKVEVEIALLRSVHWWYILPISVGVLVFLAARSRSLASFLLSAAFVIALDIFIYWLNQQAVEKSLLPLKDELESSLDFHDPVSPTPKKKLMTKQMLLGITLMLIGAALFARGQESKSKATDYDDPISKTLEEIRVKHKFPALAVAVVVDGRIVATNAVGFRKQGGEEMVKVDDKFHIGSVTKSMTATVAAMLVEQGKIKWATTVGQSLGKDVAEIHPDYRGVTLEQLLAHHGGAPGNAPRDLWREAWDASGPPAEGRGAFVKGLLTRSPEAKPGTKHIYSNQGYAIAGVMLEKATGKTWEDLMREMLFEPLGMKSAGFGAPATLNKVDHPWGHAKGLAGLKPVPPGPGADNPPAIGPAGTVHCSLADLAEYAAFHMNGERGGSKLLKAESFKKLHTSLGDDYALGWMVLERGWAGGRALMHNGSNTMFYVVVWMAPEKNSAVIVASNVGVDAAFKGCDEAASMLIKRFIAK